MDELNPDNRDWARVNFIGTVSLILGGILLLAHGLLAIMSLFSLTLLADPMMLIGLGSGILWFKAGRKLLQRELSGFTTWTWAAGLFLLWQSLHLYGLNWGAIDGSNFIVAAVIAASAIAMAWFYLRRKAKDGYFDVL